MRPKRRWPKLVLVVFLAALVGLGVGKLSTLVFGSEQVTQQEQAKPTETVTAVVQKQSAPDAASEAAADELFGSQKYRIHIHKSSHTLELYEKGQSSPIKTYYIAIARNPGDKKRAGDCTTPTSWGNAVATVTGAAAGTSSSKVAFQVESIENASYWSHDFGDGKGVIQGAYGPWFISLNTGWDGIGIHGTHDPASIGTNVSEGCIRMHNPDVDELKNIISSSKGAVGVHVIITEE